MSTSLLLNKYWRDLGYCDIRIEVASDKLKYVHLKKQTGSSTKMRLSRYVWITQNGYIPSTVKVLHVGSKHDDSIENLYTTNRREPIEYRCPICGSIHRVYETDQAVCCENKTRVKPSSEKKKKRRLSKLKEVALIRSLRKLGVSYSDIASKMKMPIVDIKEMLRVEIKHKDGSVETKLPFTDQRKISINREVRKGMKMTSRYKSYAEVRSAGLGSVSALKKQVCFKQRDRISLQILTSYINQEGVIHV